MYMREYEVIQTGFDTFDIEFRQFGKVVETIKGLSLEQCVSVENCLCKVAKSITHE